MKLKSSTGHTTKLQDTSRDSLDAARKRICSRIYPGHFLTYNHGLERYEVCRAVGGMTEQTGKFITFEVVDHDGK